MLKHILLLILASLVAVLFFHPLAIFLHSIVFLHNEIIRILGSIFSNDVWGILAKQTIGLVLIPLIVAAIPAFIYRLYSHKEWHYFYAFLWIVWVMIVICVAR
jgi:hypothetical protein